MKRAALILVAGLCLAAPAAAQTPSEPNACDSAGGAGDPCSNDADCAAKAFATACVETEAGVRSCQVPCAALDVPAGEDDRPDQGRCALGEVCSTDASGADFFCRPVAFRMDLNLLDQCILHFVERSPPVLGSDNVCALERNLNRLLDQDSDGQFTIYDVDLCVRAFLEAPVCDTVTQSCPREDLVYCEADEDCGAGLYCAPDRNACERECGRIASREVGFASLERQCARRLTECNLLRGRCETTSIEDAVCQVDADCPSGAYCFLGRCAPRCSRGIDCPDSHWFCSDNNTCRPLPPIGGDEDFVFDPAQYALLFALDTVSVDAIENETSVPVLVMDLVSKKEVLTNPAVSFGYRLEVSYGRKQTPECLKPDDELTSAEIAECTVDDTEQFITLLSPFGTLSAVGRPSIDLALDPTAAERLSPGIWNAHVRAIFDNGSSDTFTVQLNKTTPSGEYAGTFDVFLEEPDNALTGATPLNLALKLTVTDESSNWSALLEEVGLDAEEDIEDITEGVVVNGLVHANDALPFALPGARSPQDNEIPLRGLYSPRLGRLRLLFVVDLPASFCVSESGACTGDTEDFEVHNNFGRYLRRVVQLFGSYDDATRIFQGIYREAISGLSAGDDLTLDGTFLLTQLVPDEDPVVVPDRLIAAGAPDAVEFPSAAAIGEQIVADVGEHCAEIIESNGGGFVDGFWNFTNINEVGAFNSERSYGFYLDSNRYPVFEDAVEFNDILRLGLDSLADRDEAALTVYDFLSGRILLCGDHEDIDHGTSEPPACVDEGTLRCGLALHRRAIVKRFVDLSALDDARIGEHDLFCSAVLPTEDCSFAPTEDPTLATLQQHNRFWRELSQATKFQAGRDLSDAFFALFRHQVNPFAAGQALSFKAEKLRSALRLFDEGVRLFASPQAAAVLFDWPMGRFKTIGRSWLQIMHVIAADRLDAVAELVDLERRIFAGAGDEHHMVAQHLMQQEYLLQAYLIALQRRWQGPGFTYAGQAVTAFNKGQDILLQLNHTKNPLGISPDVVFFESSNPRVPNWQAYKETLAGAGGVLERGRDEIALAVQNLKDSLSDLDTLERRIFDATENYDEKLIALCGLPQQPTCSDFTAHEDEIDAFQKTRDCLLGEVDDSTFLDFGNIGASSSFDVLEEMGCESEWACNVGAFDPCGDVIATFRDRTDDNDLKPECRLDSAGEKLTLYGRERGCVGGEMGNLLQQKATLHRQLESEARQVQVLLEHLRVTSAAARQELFFRDARDLALDIGETIISIVDTVIRGAIFTRVKALATAIIPDCLVIAGFSVGTNCPGKLARFANEKVINLIINTILGSVIAKRSLASTALKITQRVFERHQFILEEGQQLSAIAIQVYDRVEAVRLLVQELFNLEVQMDHVRATALDEFDGVRVEVSFLLDHLIGRERGNVLVGEHLVGEASKTFREALRLAYKMVAAFTYRYNLSPGEAEALQARVFTAVTLDDLQDLVGELERREREYCGRESIDCDAFNNLHVLRLSLQETLFPQLRDIVDPATGQVVTKGQQFHNIITNPPYLRRRVRGAHTVDQIEIPFATWLQSISDGQRESWMISPLQCNHVIDGEPHGFGTRDQGTIGVNVLGQRLGDGSEGLRYELLRGHTDYIRECHATSTIREPGTDPVLEHPIRTRLVGYAPQSAQGRLESPPTYVSRSSENIACLNAPEEFGEMADDGCWHYFARDRSLAAPDWRLILPLTIGDAETGNSWVVGEGLPQAQRPVIEDIVLYMRHRTRPISE